MKNVNVLAAELIAFKIAEIPLLTISTSLGKVLCRVLWLHGKSLLFIAEKYYSIWASTLNK